MKYLIIEWWQTQFRTFNKGKWTPRLQFFAHLKSPNGEIILASEAYNQMSGVRKLAKALRAAGTSLKMRKRKAA